MLDGIRFFIWSISSVGAKIVFSFILGFVLLIFCSFNFPPFVKGVQSYAASFVQFIIDDVGIPAEYNVWVSFIIDDKPFVMIFFVIVARILMAIVGTVFRVAMSPASK